MADTAVRIIYYGDLRPGSTSRHRFDALRRLTWTGGLSIDSGPGGWSALLDRLSQHLYRRGLPAGDRLHRTRNDLLVEAGLSIRPDVLWLDKPLDIRPESISRIRSASPRTLVVGYSPDDMGQRHNRSLLFDRLIDEFDLFLTTKTFGVRELASMGCRRVVFIGNGYDRLAHAPIDLSPGEFAEWGSDVGFIGTYERERARSLTALAGQGFDVRVWGNGWGPARREGRLRIEGRPAEGKDFARVVAATKINLGFLRKLNRDMQTTRSIELPACGGFMLAERTDEHLALFDEGSEAEFFADDAEMIAKCRHYLVDDSARRRIALGGRKRCVASGYSNDDRMGEALRLIAAVREEHQ
jgi:spore maturation protein CgeB